MTDTTQLTETVDERDAPVGDDIEKLRAAKEKANAEAAARRLEVKALKEELDALKQTQAATETAALAEQGKFKELYETAENRAATLEKQLREQADEIAAQKLALLQVVALGNFASKTANLKAAKQVVKSLLTCSK